MLPIKKGKAPKATTTKTVRQRKPKAQPEDQLKAAADMPAAGAKARVRRAVQYGSMDEDKAKESEDAAEESEDSEEEYNIEDKRARP